MFFQVLFHALTSSNTSQTALQFAALLLLPALGGVISERSGVVNIAMEGMMLTGAYAGVMTTLATHNVIIGALGLTNYLLFIQTGGQGVPSLKDALRLPNLAWGPLANIPFIGRVLFQQNIIFYVAVLILLGIHFLLFRINIGLRIRAVGEHPQAADTAGGNVRLI